MFVKTARFGEIEVAENGIVTFVNPILGFNEYVRYILMDSFDGDSPFQFIQSIDDEQLTFVITDPFIFNKEYEFDISKRWLDLLKIGHANDILIKVIVTIRSSKDISMNLKAPIVINSQTNEAAQIILEDTQYIARYPLNASQKGGMGSNADTIKK